MTKEFITLEELDVSSSYKLLIQLVIPRPIAWVSTRSAQGSTNLAPFSYFNLVATKPSVLMISFNYSETKGFKDTYRNIKESLEFGVNLPRFEQMELVVSSAADYPYGTSEIDALNIDTFQSKLINAPLVSNCHINFECKYLQEAHFGEGPGSCWVVFGNILAVHIDKSLFEGDLIINPRKLNPLCRLGRSQYSSLGEIKEMPVPKIKS